jgi:hypothetical protein
MLTKQLTPFEINVSNLWLETFAVGAGLALSWAQQGAHLRRQETGLTDGNLRNEAYCWLKTKED